MGEGTEEAWSGSRPGCSICVTLGWLHPLPQPPTRIPDGGVGGKSDLSESEILWDSGMFFTLRAWLNLGKWMVRDCQLRGGTNLILDAISPPELETLCVLVHNDSSSRVLGFTSQA